MPTSHTLGVTIDAPPATVYAFVANPENLPRWATAFCRSVRRDGDGWVVETPAGPASIRFAAENALGVLDHHVRPASGGEVYVPMRVVPNGAGSEVLFTLFREPGTPDDAFAADRAMVEADLARLRAALEG